MAQRQFRSDDTSVWLDRYGNGSDGAYSPSTSVDAPIKATCTGSSGATSLAATNTSFVAGQLLIIYQSINGTPGFWEFNKIQSYVAGTITLTYPLTGNYVSVSFVQVMPQYTTATIALIGTTITSSAWNGSTGGIYALFARDSAIYNGSIEGSAKGYRGGPGTSDTGFQGEGTGGFGSHNQGSNGTGGGGGLPGTDGGHVEGGTGAGGGNGTAGSNGAGRNFAGGGIGADAGGNAELTILNFGGGGGAGGSRNGGVPGGQIGGTGAGILIIVSPIITFNPGSSIHYVGEQGANSSGPEGASGSGAGGSILLKGNFITNNSSLLFAQGGAPGQNTGGFPATAGSGGVGRIHADYGTSVVAGSADPAMTTRQDSVLAGSSGAFIFNMI